MKTNSYKLIMGMFILVALMGLASAEITFWEEVKIRESENAVSSYSYHQFYDDIELGESVLLDLKRAWYSGRTIRVVLEAQVQPMPNINDNYNITRCIWNVTHIKNDYDALGNLVNVSEEFYNFEYNNTPLTVETLPLELRNRDAITSDVKCYYSNGDFLYDESLLFAQAFTYFPAHKCNDCTEFTLEELSNEIDRADEVTNTQTQIYVIIQRVFDFNFNIWLIASWLVKILMFLFAVSFAFYGLYAIYHLLKDVESRI